METAPTNPLMKAARRLAIALVAVALIVAVASRFLPGPTDVPSTSQTNFQLLRDGLTQSGKSNWSAVGQTVAALSSRGAQRESLILQAQKALVEGSPEDALACLNKESLGDLEVVAWPIRVQAMLQSGQLMEAEQIAKYWGGRFPKNPLPFRILGSVYYELGAMEPAVQALETLVELVPDDPNPHYLLGVIYHDFERFDEAVAAFQEYFEVQQSDAKNWSEAIRRSTDSKIRLRNYKGALEFLRANRKTSPSATFLAMEAECLWNLGDTDLAAKTLALAESSDAQDPTYLQVQAQFLFQQDEYQRCIKVLLKLLQQRPHDLLARHLLAQAYQLNGDETAAAAETDRWQQSQQLKDNLSALQREALFDPWDAGIRDRIATLHDQLGQPDYAKMWRDSADQSRRASSKLDAQQPRVPETPNPQTGESTSMRGAVVGGLTD